MCVNVSFVIYCVVLYLCVVVLVCSSNVLLRFDVGLLRDALWLAFVLCFCG